MSQGTNTGRQFQHLDRAAVETQFQGPGERTVPLGMVGGPYRTGARWQDNAGILDRAFRGLGVAINARMAKAQEDDNLRGQMLQMQGKSYQELVNAGEQVATKQGYIDMQEQRRMADWYSTEQDFIKNGGGAQLDPASYMERLEKMRVSQETGHLYTDTQNTRLAMKYFPDLVQKQTLANQEWISGETKNAYVDHLVSASRAQDSNILGYIDLTTPINRNNGMSVESTRDAVYEALSLSMAEGDGFLAKQMGVIGGEGRDIPKSDAIAKSFSAGLKADIEWAAKQSGLDPALLARVVATESAGHEDATSWAGAKGLMQLMPGTQSEQEKKYGIKGDTARGNLVLGALYLKEQIDRFGSVEDGLRAYNGGPRTVQNWITANRGYALNKETQEYVGKVLGETVKGAPEKILDKYGFSPAQKESLIKQREDFIKVRSEDISLSVYDQYQRVRQSVVDDEIGYSEALARLPQGLPVEWQRQMINDDIASDVKSRNASLKASEDAYEAAAKHVSAEANIEFTSILGSITDDESSVKAAVDQTYQLLDGKPDEVVSAFVKRVYSRYDSIYLKGLEEGTIKQADFPQDQFLWLNDALTNYRVQAQIPGVDHGALYSQTLGSIQAYGEANGWGPGEMRYVTGVMRKDLDSMGRTLAADTRRQYQKVQDEKLLRAEAEAAYRTGTLYTLPKKQQAMGYELMKQEAIQQAANLVAQNPDADENAQAFTAMSILGKRVAGYSELTFDEVKSTLTHLGVTPQFSPDGKVSSDWKGAYAMYQSMFDVDPVLATKYAGADVALKMMMIRDLDASNMDTDQAAMTVFSQSKEQMDNYKEVSNRVASAAYQDELRPLVQEQIEAMLPTWLFSNDSGAQARVNDNDIQVALQSPVLTSTVNRIASTMLRAAPATTTEQLARAAVPAAISQLTYVGGNFVASDNGRSLADTIGIEQSYQGDGLAVNNAVHAYLNTFMPLTEAESAAFEKPGVDYQFTDPTTGVSRASWENATKYIGYIPSSDMFIVNAYYIDDKGTEVQLDSKAISGASVGAYYNSLISKQVETARKNEAPIYGEIKRGVQSVVSGARQNRTNLTPLARLLPRNQ